MPVCTCMGMAEVGGRRNILGVPIFLQKKIIACNGLFCHKNIRMSQSTCSTEIYLDDNMGYSVDVSILHKLLCFCYTFIHKDMKNTLTNNGKI